MSQVELAVLEGQTLASCERVEKARGGYDCGEGIKFVLTTGATYYLTHSQDCYERVSIEDITGDLADLVGAPLIVVEERDNVDETEHGVHKTWTFYTFRTIKGTVTIRFYGTSNGYYSESAALYQDDGAL